MRPIKLADVKASSLHEGETCMAVTPEDLATIRRALSLSASFLHIYHRDAAAAYEAGEYPAGEHSAGFVQEASEMGTLTNQLVASSFEYKID